ncbi:MAG: D-2-hydroxyacid dehydrogenase [Lachnospiraceae bacterium]|jgi:glycerate dehydrogenase|nr:D-2-hydroxyacid dehydrogenase [Lachnospiraceae bacterium]
MKLVVLERNSVGTDVDVSCFERFGEVEYYPNTVAENTAERVKDADIVIANKAPMNESTLKDAPDVKLICLFATGFDNVDLDYCKSRSIKVANVVNYSTAAVVQHTLMLALALEEKLAFYDDYVKSDTYANQDRFSNFDRPFGEFEGKTWGIVGMGNIGRRVARVAQALGCKVIFYSASGNSTCTEYERVELDTLLAQSDILSLHCPLSDRTRGLINKEAFARMKKSAILVNVARGPVVDTQALYEALTEGQIAAAGLDVLEKEPISKDNPLGNIKDSTKLIITPHMAWASTEARERLVSEVSKNIEAFLGGEDRNIVNK